jgi:hypothetical protein
MNKKIMSTSVFLGLLLLSACGGKQSSMKMGETTRADVISQKGEPLSEETPPVKDATIMNYENGEKIQLKGDIVTNRFTNPSGDEKLVMWWKHKFKSCAFLKSTTLAQDPKSHTPPEIEMACPEQGLSVIYVQGSDIVSRVVENEKK